MKFRTASLASVLLATVCVAGLTSPGLAAMQSAPAPAAAAQTPDARLRALFHDSDEANLRRNPLTAMFRGDFRYADHLGNYLTDEYYNAERQAAEQDLAALRTIDRNALTATDRL